MRTSTATETITTNVTAETTAPQPPQAGRAPAVAMTRGWTSGHIFLLFLLVGIALVLRLWQIEQLPPGFHFDESFEGLEAWRILTDPSYRPIFLTGNFGVPPLNAYLNAITFGLWQQLDLPVGPLPMRVTAAVVGSVSVLALYALAQELRRLPAMAALSVAFPFLAGALLATMRWHIHFSRMGIEPVYVPLVWIVATWLLLRGWRTGARSTSVGSGVALAAGMYAYQGAWVIPFIIAATAGLLLVQLYRPQQQTSDRPSQPPVTMPRRWQGLFLAAGVALMLVLPLAWFFWQQPELLIMRPAQLSIVGSTPSPADSGIADSVWATAKMFGPLGTPGDQDPRRNLPGAPALSVWYALPFYGGLLLALYRFYHLPNAILLIGLTGLLAPGMVSEYAPHFHRILGAAAPVALLSALALDWLWRNGTRWHLGRCVVLLLLVGGTLRESQNYFVRWAALPDLFHAFDVGLWTVGQQIAATPPTTPLYLTPRSADHATLAFALATRPDAHVPPVTFDGRSIFPLTAGAISVAEEYVVIEHEDFRTRLLLPGLFPEAVMTNQITAADGGLYAQTYVRPAGSTLARQPQHFLQVDQSPVPLGDGIALLGYDAQPATLNAGDVLYVQLYWLIDTPPTADWTIFVHLLEETTSAADDSNDSMLLRVAGHDSRPGAGSLPTTHWQAGWQILDEYQVPLPPELPAGEYIVAVGLYQADGTTLPADGGRVLLGPVTIGTRAN